MVKAKLMEKAKELILVGLFEGGVQLGLLSIYKAIFSAKYTEHSLSPISANKGLKAKKILIRTV
jgi:hypothetical protein